MADWLSMGAAAYVDQEKEWELAFPPLFLRPQADPAEQIVAAIDKLAESSQVAYGRMQQAVGRALETLGTSAAPRYVDFFFTLACTLRPPKLMEMTRKLLQRQFVRDDPVPWIEPIGTAVIAISNYPYSEAFDDLMSDLRTMGLWQPFWALHYVTCRIGSAPRDWVSALLQIESDLVWLDEHDTVQFDTLLREIARMVEPKAIAMELSRFVVGDLQRQRFVVEKLIGGKNAPITITPKNELIQGSRSAHLPRFFESDASDDEITKMVYFTENKWELPDTHPTLSERQSRERVQEAVKRLEQVSEDA